MTEQSVAHDAWCLSCFLFRPRKSCEKRRKRSHIPTFPMHRSYRLQGSLKRRYKHPSLLPSMGTTRQKSSCRNGLQNGPRLLSRVKAGYTLAFANRIAHSGLHAETGAFRTGPLSLPSAHSARSRTSPGRVSERQTLPLLGLGRGCAPEERREPRDSDALKHFASLSHLGKRQPEEADARIRRASASSGTAAPLGCENHSLPQ